MTRANPMRVPSPTATAEKPPQITIEAAPSNLPAVAAPSQGGRPMLVDAPKPDAPAPPASVAKIAEAISAVMSEIGIVGKDGLNKFQNYKYAKMEDILQKLTPLIAKNGLAIIQTEMDRSMFDNDNVIAIRYGFTIVHKSGEVWPDRPVQTGASRCRDSKGGFDDKSLNKAHTAARKYFLLALFQIPTGDEDDGDAGHADHRPQQRPVPSPGGNAERAMEARGQPPTAKGDRFYREAPLPTSPQALPTEGMSIQAWAPRFIACVTNAKSVAELTEWEKLNSQALDLVDQKAPLLYDTICTAFQNRQGKLAAGGPEKAAEVPSPAPASDKGGAPATQPAPAAANGGIPDATTAPDDFLKWSDAEMAKVVDPHSLEVMFNDFIEPQATGLMEPDRSELLALFTKHERRLGVD